MHSASLHKRSVRSDSNGATGRRNQGGSRLTPSTIQEYALHRKSLFDVATDNFLTGKKASRKVAKPRDIDTLLPLGSDRDYMVSEDAVASLRELDAEIAKNWYHHQKKMNTADDLLHFPIADGIFDAKFDGLTHAANLTAKSLAKYVQDPDADMDITNVTKWTGGNQAIRYARSQADFHWEIDTRMWQYFLLMTAMRRSFRDAIQRTDEITGNDETELLRLNNEFWDEVLVHYTYRTEIIERTRGFAEHPDNAAGSNRYGYEYEVTRDRTKWSEYTLDKLDLNVDKELIKKDMTERGVTSSSDKVHVPSPFPPVKKEVDTGIKKAAKKWIEAAKNYDITDEYLRVVMGSSEEKRWIPTRYVGWKIGIEDVTLPYLEEFSSDITENRGEYQGFNLDDPAVRFGLCQAEFQQRLKGTCDQLIAYLKSQQQGIDRLHKSDTAVGITLENIESFFDIVYETVEAFFEQSLDIDSECLNEVESGRPVHPRFAPHDPEEPLPWKTDDPEKHQRFMKVRGFTI